MNREEDNQGRSVSTEQQNDPEHLALKKKFWSYEKTLSDTKKYIQELEAESQVGFIFKKKKTYYLIK